MKKKALTKKEIDQSLAGLSMNDQILADKVFQHEMILSLILKHDKELDKFIRKKLKEVEQHKSQDKK